MKKNEMIVEEITSAWDEFKKVIDKYPDVLEVKFLEEVGYILILNQKKINDL